MSHKLLQHWTARGFAANTTLLQKIYPCQVCNQTFRRNCYLILHIKSHAFRCAHCDKPFKHKSLLRRHIFSVHSVVIKEFKEKRKEKRKSNFTCEHCSKEFALKYDYKIHLWNYHRHKYVCGYMYCKKEFKSREEYIQHRTEHIIHTCHVCEKKVKDIRNHMNMHLKKFFKCHMCKKGFKQYNNLRRHMRIHLRIKPFSCRDCGKSFTQKYNMIIHNRIHTGKKPFECKVCKKKFVRSTALKIHELSLHGGKDARSFKCIECNFSTVVQWKLKEHQTNVHSARHECSVCYMNFESRIALIRHSTIHSNKKPFPCPHCIKEYFRKADLTKHLRRFHESTVV